MNSEVKVRRIVPEESEFDEGLIRESECERRETLRKATVKRHKKRNRANVFGTIKRQNLN